jgi:DNA-binding MarR family transcriptional regulator
MPIITVRAGMQVVDFGTFEVERPLSLPAEERRLLYAQAAEKAGLPVDKFPPSQNWVTNGWIAEVMRVMKPIPSSKPEEVEPISYIKDEPEAFDPAHSVEPSECKAVSKPRKPRVYKPDPEFIEGFSEEDSKYVLSKRRGKPRTLAFVKILLVKDGGELKRRTADMAEQLGVSSSSLSANIRKLVKDGILVITNHKYKRGMTGKTYKLAEEITPELLAEKAKVFSESADKLVTANGRQLYVSVGPKKFKHLGAFDE